jgi:hypothetical protein
MSVSYGGDSIIFADGSVNSSGFIGHRNRIINGAMAINQRAASVTASGYTVDRFQYVASASSKGTLAQSTTVYPTGFNYSLGFTSSSAYSVASGDYFAINQTIEGYNIADLGWGTSNAQPVTLSFWVYSSLTGTFGGSLSSYASTRSYPFTYTISSANTWTKISITVVGDTTVSATNWKINNDAGMNVWFGLGVGTTYSGTAGAWAGTAYYSATGATSVVGTNGATFYITGVQLERGSTASSFEYRSYGAEFVLCQRYFAKSYNDNVVPGTATQVGMEVCAWQGAGGVGGVYGNVKFPVKMRTTPGTINIWDGAGTATSASSYTYGGGGSAQAIANGGAWWGSGTPFNTSHSGFFMRPTSTQASAWNYVHYTADAEL